MRAIACIALMACAPQAASLPWVRIDNTLSGDVCSRDAAIIIAQKREQERGEWKKQIITCDERFEAADAKARQAQWWQVNAPWLIVGGAIVSAAVGFVAGFAIGERHAR